MHLCDRLQQEKQELEDQRLKQFCSAMRAVNGSLGSIYQKLTAGQGDAYLTYKEDALLLFAEGVHFHVRSARGQVGICQKDLGRSFRKFDKSLESFVAHCWGMQRCVLHFLGHNFRAQVLVDTRAMKSCSAYSATVDCAGPVQCHFCMRCS